MGKRRTMATDDWIHASINALIGVLLGSVAYGLLQLAAGGSWLMAIILVLLGGGLFLFMVLFDTLFDRLFPIGIRPAKDPQPRPPKPLLRVFSLPLGLILGMALAALGLDRTILAFLS